MDHLLSSFNVSGDLTQTEFLNRLSNPALSDSKISELSREKLSSGMLGSSSWFKTAQCWYIERAQLWNHELESHEISTKLSGFSTKSVISKITRDLTFVYIFHSFF